MVNSIRRQLIQALVDLEDIGGRDKPKESLLDVLKGLKIGVPYLFLRNAFEDDLLVSARKELIEAKLIKQTGKRGDDVSLKAVPQPTDAENMESGGEEAGAGSDVTAEGSATEPATAPASKK